MCVLAFLYIFSHPFMLTLAAPLLSCCGRSETDGDGGRFIILFFCWFLFSLSLPHSPSSSLYHQPSSSAWRLTSSRSPPDDIKHETGGYGGGVLCSSPYFPVVIALRFSLFVCSFLRSSLAPRGVFTSGLKPKLQTALACDGR